MRISGNVKRQLRVKRAFRVRKKLFGTSEKPRLCVNKSNKHLIAQLIDDSRGVTLASFSTKSKVLKGTDLARKGKDSAKRVGEEIASKALELHIKEVVFDRGHHKYHGILAVLAETAREKGLHF